MKDIINPVADPLNIHNESSEPSLDYKAEYEKLIKENNMLRRELELVKRIHFKTLEKIFEDKL